MDFAAVFTKQVVAFSMKPLRTICALLLCVVTAKAELRLGNDHLSVKTDAHGSLIELKSNGFNQLADGGPIPALWLITIADGQKVQQLSPDHLPNPTAENVSDDSCRLTWNNVTNVSGGFRVEVFVTFDKQNPMLSRWDLRVTKPKNLRIEEIRFPRIGRLRERTSECLAVPKQLGLLARDPRALIERSGRHITWHSPHGTDLSFPCLAYYQDNGPGLYAACDDTQGFLKDFALSTDGEGRLYFEITHRPEQGALDESNFQLPFTVVLGAFNGDWTTAAEIYRASPAAKKFAEQGRRRQQLAPQWTRDAGLWLWNRGRSSQVLDPAIDLRQYIGTPVSILWHWWHNCAYDAGFPEYLPPREGTDQFKAALSHAQRRDIHAILYMNQRLWGTNTQSWTAENARAAAVKTAGGKVVIESYNKFTNAPCAPMCNATEFWRNKYAGLAQQVLCGLKADGIYMDQGGVLASCYDSTHGHILGPGRYWSKGFRALTDEIRKRTATRGAVALGCEYGGEPWLGDFDLTLGLCVSHDRIGSLADWEPIPFFQAVYHPSVTIFGNLTGLAHPPYDEKWPPESAPATAMTLLDRKYSPQFYLDQARTFVWGMQPMLANFSVDQLKQRADELDYVKRLVQTRMRALKYLAHGTWLRPPPLNVPEQQMEICTLGVYTPLNSSHRKYPVAIAGAWRAPDGDIAIALASISDEKLALTIPIDSREYAIADKSPIYQIDAKGRHHIGTFPAQHPNVELELSAHGLCLLEFPKRH